MPFGQINNKSATQKPQNEIDSIQFSGLESEITPNLISNDLYDCFNKSYTYLPNAFIESERTHMGDSLNHKINYRAFIKYYYMFAVAIKRA